VNDKLSSMLKAMNHLTSATRFYHDEKRNDTDWELKCAIKELTEHLEDVEVEFNGMD